MTPSLGQEMFNMSLAILLGKPGSHGRLRHVLGHGSNIKGPHWPKVGLPLAKKDNIRKRLQLNKHIQSHEFITIFLNFITKNLLHLFFFFVIKVCWVDNSQESYRGFKCTILAVHLLIRWLPFNFGSIAKTFSSLQCFPMYLVGSNLLGFSKF